MWEDKRRWNCGKYLVSFQQTAVWSTLYFTPYPAFAYYFTHYIVLFPTPSPIPTPIPSLITTSFPTFTSTPSSLAHRTRPAPLGSWGGSCFGLRRCPYRQLLSGGACTGSRCLELPVPAVVAWWVIYTQRLLAELLHQFYCQENNEVQIVNGQQDYLVTD